VQDFLLPTAAQIQSRCASQTHALGGDDIWSWPSEGTGS